MLDRTVGDNPELTPSLAPQRRIGRKWRRTTLVHFGYMLGMGFSGPQIGEVIGCSTASIANACRRYGVQLARRRNRDEVVPVVISKETAAVFEDAALLRGISRKVLIERLLGALGEDEEQTLIDNVLDDMEDGARGL